MNKISIIGTGSVGSTIAYTLTVMGIASEIVMIDINNEKHSEKLSTSDREHRFVRPARSMRAVTGMRKVPTLLF